MGNVKVNTKVTMRNRMGQFISDVEHAATASAMEAAERGAQMSASRAPRGTKDDPRTEKLHESIRVRPLSRSSAEWYSTARHALPIETGATEHHITSAVTFFWEKQGRDWVGAPDAGVGTPISHPGNAAQPYLRPVAKIIQNQLADLMKKHYPG